MPQDAHSVALGRCDNLAESPRRRGPRGGANIVSYNDYVTAKAECSGVYLDRIARGHCDHINSGGDVAPDVGQGTVPYLLTVLSLLLPNVGLAMVAIPVGIDLIYDFAMAGILLLGSAVSIMPFTYNGFGTTFYGEADHHPDGSFITTKWIVAAYIPLIPLRSYRLARSGNLFENSLSHRTFAVLEELPIFWSQVLRVYGYFLCACAWYAISIWFFFSKLALDDLHVSHRITDILLVIAFIATLAAPLIIVWLIRRRSMLKVGVTPPELGDNFEAGKKLGPAGKLFLFVAAMILVVPPIIVTEFNLPPASWLNMRRPNSSVVYYYPEFTLMVMLFANLAVLGAILLLVSSITKMLTGKKLGELFRTGSGKDARAKEPEKTGPSPTTAAPQTSAAAPQAGRKEVFITHCHMCECSIEPEQQSTLNTCPECGADLSRQRVYARR